jgi:hypothetical protein
MQPTAGRRNVSFLFMAAALLPACAFDESRDYRITGGAHRDSAKVKQIVQSIATQAGLPRQAPVAGDSHTIALYMNTTFNSVLASPAMRSGSSLGRTDWPPPRAFKRADHLLEPVLSSTFGRRFTLEKWDAEGIIVVYSSDLILVRSHTQGG